MGNLVTGEGKHGQLFIQYKLFCRCGMNHSAEGVISWLIGVKFDGDSIQHSIEMKNCCRALSAGSNARMQGGTLAHQVKLHPISTLPLQCSSRHP